MQTGVLTNLRAKGFIQWSLGSNLKAVWLTKWSFGTILEQKGLLNEGSALYECCRVLSKFSGLNVTFKGDNECKKVHISSYL